MLGQNNLLKPPPGLSQGSLPDLSQSRVSCFIWPVRSGVQPVRQRPWRYAPRPLLSGQTRNPHRDGALPPEALTAASHFPGRGVQGTAARFGLRQLPATVPAPVPLGMGCAFAAASPSAQPGARTALRKLRAPNLVSGGPPRHPGSGCHRGSPIM